MKGNEKIVERLIARILFLEGRPVVSQLGAIAIGIDVEDMNKKDWGAEKKAIEGQRDQISQMGIATYLGQQM